MVPCPRSYDVEVIAPASERQIIRARPEDRSVGRESLVVLQPLEEDMMRHVLIDSCSYRFLVRETGEMYDRALGPMIRGLREDGRSIQWVYNILDHKKEVERWAGREDERYNPSASAFTH